MKFTFENKSSLKGQVESVWSNVRDELTERRQERAERRELRADLATYNTPAEIEDLLGSLRGVDGPEVDEVRDLLSRNLMQVRRLVS